MKRILTSIVLAASLLGAMAVPQALAAKPGSATAAPKVFASPQPVGTKATCPVTGEQLVISKETMHVVHKGKHVYFCCPACHEPFAKDPDKYTKR